MMDGFIRIFVFIIIISNAENGYTELPSMLHVRSTASHCWKSLMEMDSLKDEQFSARSFYQNKSNFKPHQSRLLDIFKSNPQPNNGNAWCPQGKVGTALKEWIEVNFSGLKVINGIYTKGRGEGNFIEFVPTIKITYHRGNKDEIFEYKTIDRNSIIPVNTDARTQSRTNFFPPIVASSVRIYPFDTENTQMVCLKFAMFGCDFSDAPISYTTDDGDMFLNGDFAYVSTKDLIYDGIKIPDGNGKTVLKGGLGLLTDNKAWLGSLTDLRDSYFLGWHFSMINIKPFISIYWHYNTKRNFTKLLIFSHMLSNRTIDIFTKIILRFNVNEDLAFQIHKNILDTNLEFRPSGGVIFTLSLENIIGDMVEVQLHKSGFGWIFISEINFQSTLAQNLKPVKTRNKNSTSTSTNINTIRFKNENINMNWSSPTNKIPDFYPNLPNGGILMDMDRDVTFTLAAVGCLIILILLIFLIGFLFVKIKRRRHLKKNSKVQYMTGNEIGSIYQQYSQVEKVFLPPSKHQSHSLSSDNGSNKMDPRIVDCSLYSSLPHHYNKETTNNQEDETYLLKEYSNINNSFTIQRSVTNIPPNSNSLSTNTQLLPPLWNAKPLIKNNCQEYASSTLFPITPQSLNNKRLSENSIIFHSSYRPLPHTQSPFHLSSGSPLFKNHSLGMSQLPSNIQIIANPYFDHMDQFSNSTSNDFDTPLSVRKSYLPMNETMNRNNLSLMKQSFNRYHSTESTHLSLQTLTKLFHIQSVCGHTSFGAVDYDELVNVYSFNHTESKLPIMPISNVTLVDLLCQGQYGQTHSAVMPGNHESKSFVDINDKFQDNNKSRQIIISFIDQNCPADLRSQFQNEIRIRIRLSDPNIAKVIGLVIESVASSDDQIHNSQFGLVTECFTNLHHFIRINSAPQQEIHNSTMDFSYTLQNVNVFHNQLNYGRLLYISSQIASGMKHMDEQGIVHRDLACRSCTIGPNLQVKITNGGRRINSPYECDYLTIPLSDGRTVSLPIRWMSPESLFYAKFSSKSDVWSFAVTLWEILSYCYQQPYYYWSNNEVIDNTFNFMSMQSIQFHYLSCPNNCPKEIYDMVRECWHPKQEYRPSFREIHMFLQRKNFGFTNTEYDFSK